MHPTPALWLWEGEPACVLLVPGPASDGAQGGAGPAEVSPGDTISSGESGPVPRPAWVRRAPSILDTTSERVEGRAPHPWQGAWRPQRRPSAWAAGQWHPSWGPVMTPVGLWAHRLCGPVTWGSSSFPVPARPKARPPCSGAYPESSSPGPTGKTANVSTEGPKSTPQVHGSPSWGRGQAKGP